MSVRDPRGTFRGVALRWLVAVTVVLGSVGFVYHDQAVRYVTHRKGSPTETSTWSPFPADEPLELHLAVVGDVGHPGARLTATARAVDELDAIEPVDELVLTGDNVYPSGDPSRLSDTVFRPFAHVLGHAELAAETPHRQRLGAVAVDELERRSQDPLTRQRRPRSGLALAVPGAHGVDSVQRKC